jgi:hypothetical protein
MVVLTLNAILEKLLETSPENILYYFESYFREYTARIDDLTPLTQHLFEQLNTKFSKTLHDREIQTSKRAHNL